MILSQADYRPFLPRISRICEEFEVNFACLQVEKEIGQVWRQMGIMYGQLSNSISILEKVSTARHHAIYEYFSSSSSNNTVVVLLTQEAKLVAFILTPSVVILR